MNNKPLFYPRAAKAGFSVLETVIGLAIGTLAVVVIVTFMIEANRLQKFVSEQSSAINIADDASNTMTKALREMVDGADGSFAIAVAGPNTLTFFSDIDADSNTEQITYTLSNTTLQQTIIEPTAAPAQYLPANGLTKTIAYGVVNGTYTGIPIFTYYDNNNVALTEPIDLAAVTLIQIHLDVNIDPNQVPDTHTIETYAQLRNLNDNL